jgi:hypothetical protein
MGTKINKIGEISHAALNLTRSLDPSFCNFVLDRTCEVTAASW